MNDSSNLLVKNLFHEQFFLVVVFLERTAADGGIKVHCDVMGTESCGVQFFTPPMLSDIHRLCCGCPEQGRRTAPGSVEPSR